MFLKKVIKYAQYILKKKIISDTILLQFNSIFLQAISFLTLFLSTKLLGINKFGQYRLIISILQILSIISSINFSALFAVKVPEAYYKKNRNELIQLISHYFKFNLFTSIFCVLINIIFATKISKFLYNDPKLGNLAIILSLGAIFDIFTNFTKFCFQSVRSMKKLARLGLWNATITFVITISFLIYSPSLFSIINALLISKIIVSFISIYWYFNFYRSYNIFPQFIEIVKNLRFSHNKFNLEIFYSNLQKKSSNFLELIPTLLLGKFSTLENVALWEISLKIIQIPLKFYSSFLKSMTAKLPEMKIKLTPAEFKSKTIKIISIMFLISLIISIIIFFIFPFIINVFWKNISISQTAILILCLRIMFDGASIFMGLLSRIFNRNKQISIILIFNILFSLSTGYYLVKNYNFNGICLLYTLSLYFTLFIFYFIDFRKVLENHCKKQKKSCILK